MADVRHRLLAAVLPAAIAASSLTGCSQGLPVDSGELVIAFPGAPSAIDPRLSTDAYGTQILQMTHASLLRMDAAGNHPPDPSECGGGAMSPARHRTTRSPVPGFCGMTSGFPDDDGMFPCRSAKTARTCS